MEWDEEKAKEIVKKHKSRFSLRLTLKIIRIVFVLFILYTIYMVVVSVLYDKSKVGERTTYYQQLAIDWTYPALTTDFGHNSENEITPFFTQKINLSLMRTIGKESYPVTKLHLKKPLLTMFTQTKIDGYDQFHLSNDNRFSFYLPYHPETDQKLTGNEPIGTWETLEKVHEGHVADMAFSLDNYYSPAEVTEILSAYDLSITWMPIYMGELTEFEEGAWGGGGDSVALQQPWGLSGGREVSDDYRSGSLMMEITNEQVDESEEMMLNNMEMMLTEKKRLAETLLQTSYLQERYDYLTEHGFNAYGAIVTGPVKELLKLKEEEKIHSAQLGEIKYWNWYD